jgi:catechol 2,3-dioxygenase-like lactoylglutathione lyase family enzyme
MAEVAQPGCLRAEGELVTTTELRLGVIGQIAIAVHDLEKCVSFYRDALGLPFLFEVPGMAFLDCGGVRLMLSSIIEPGFDHAGSTLYFRVADIDAAHVALRDRGVAFIDAPHRVADLGTHELWMTFFRDPERTTHALMEERRKQG